MINPVIGPKKKGDFLSKIVLESYEKLIKEKIYPENKVMLAGFYSYSRFAGPREAVFTAICRKNMGCSHFIVGRDHSGVGNFYSNAMTREIFDEIGEIGIQPLFFDEVGYNKRKDIYESTTATRSRLQMISGSEARRAIRENRTLPDWYMRPIIQDQLRADIAAERAVFND